VSGDSVNEGIIVTGGSLHANNVAVGRKATIKGTAIQSTTESADLAEKVEILRRLLREHESELTDSTAAVAHADDVAAELAKDVPTMSVVHKLLAGLRTAVGPVTAVAEAVAALTHAIAG
jgi:Family of unknown function (DUF5955)